MSQQKSIQGRLAIIRCWQLLAEQQTGKSALQQIREIAALRRMRGHCGLSDYYWYRLYDNAYLQGRGAQDFLGWRLQAQLSLAMNPRNVVLPAWDKIVFMTLADSVGLPLVPTVATFKASARLPRIFGRHLHTRAETAEFMRDPAIYPLFAKPAYSQQGYGSAYLDGYDPTQDRLHLLNGETILVEEFLKRLDTTVDYRYHRPECGFLFQKPLHPAEPILQLTGWKAICGARVVCLNGPDGCTPLRAIWKIAIPPNHVDNFSLGKYGNLLANIDTTSGSISRIISGLWPDTHLFSQHPISGNPFAGFRLPDWSNVLDYCRTIGQLIPMMRIQHIDFAFSDSGPRILELNDIGGTEIAQLHGYGILTESACRFIKRFGNAKEYSWINGL